MMNRYKGIACIVFSAFCFALMNVFVRLSGDLLSVQKSFFRNLVAFGFAAFLLWKDRTPLRCQKGNLKYLIVRSVCGTIGILGNFYAVDHLVLADASMLSKMSPFFTILFSVLILKERVTRAQGAAVVCAFLGSLFVIKPSFSNVNLVPALAGLAGGVAAGAAYTLVRLLGERGEKKALIVCFFSGFSCLAVLPVLIFDYHPMTPGQIGMLLLAGLAASGGQFGVTAAYCYAPAREISVYDYSQILFAALLGFLIFGQLPDLWSVLGYVIVCGVAAAMFVHDRKQ